MVKGGPKGKGHFMDSPRPCKLKLDEEKSKYADLGQQNAFGMALLLIQKST